MDSDTEAVIIAAALAMLGVAAVVAIATPVLSTALASRSWIDLGDHIDALSRLPSTLSKPAHAYPPEQHDQVASPGLWWGTAAAITATLLAGSAWVGSWVVDCRRGAGGWAHRSDTRMLRREARHHGVVLGTHEHRRLALEQRHSLLVVGATQTHKSTGLAVPAILEADDMAIIAISIKDDLVSDTIGWRSTLHGHQWVYDPTNVFGPVNDTDLDELSGDDRRHAELRPRIVRAGWSPLASAVTWQGALATAFDLTRAGSSADGAADSDNKFFYESAESLLACYLYAAANSDGSMRTVIRWIAQHVREHVEAILNELPSTDAVEFFRGIFKDDRKTLANIFSTARVIVAAYLDPNVAASAERCDITPDGFFDGNPNTLYLVAPPANQDRLRVVFNMVVKQFIDAAYARVLAHGRPLDRRVLIVIDELANIAPIPNLGGVASTAASQGLQLISIVQDLSQLHTRYGSNDANTIINNHRALLLLTGVKDTVTLEHASKLLGNIEHTATSITRDEWRTRSRTESTREQPLAPLNHLRQQPEGHGTLIYGNARGIQLRLRPWFTNRHLTTRARHVPEGDAAINPLPEPTTTSSRREEGSPR